MNWRDCPWRVKVALIAHYVCMINDHKDRCITEECPLVKLGQRIEKLEHWCELNKKGGDRDE